MKDSLQKRLFQLLQDPRVAKLIQHPATANTLMKVLNGASDLRGVLMHRVHDLAKSLDLVSKQELDALRKELRNVQQELAKQRAKAGVSGSGPSSNTN